MGRRIGKDEYTPPDAVVVHWLDAADGPPGWEDITTLAPLELVKCTSIGFILAENDEAIVLVTTVGDTALSGRVVIPRGCIASMRRLMPGRRRRGKGV